MSNKENASKDTKGKPYIVVSRGWALRNWKPEFRKLMIQFRYYIWFGLKAKEVNILFRDLKSRKLFNRFMDEAKIKMIERELKQSKIQVGEKKE